jgi:hypothetical protein
MSDTKGAVAGEHRVRYSSASIRFVVRLQPQRRVARVAIHVEPDGRVIVDVPPDASHDIVLAAVRKRARWIDRHLEAAMARRGSVQPRQYVSGESLMYMGRRYRLKVHVDPDAPVGSTMRAGYLVVSVPRKNAEMVRAGIEDWYRERAREVYEQRLAAVASPLRWVRQLPPTRLRHMR